MNELTRQAHNILFGKEYTALPIPAVDFIPSDLQGTWSIAGYPYQMGTKCQTLNISADGDSPSLPEIIYHLDLEEDTRRYRRVVKIADALGKDDFRYLGRRSAIMLCAFIATGRVETMWNELMGERGAFVSSNIYRLPNAKYPNVYWARLVYEKKEAGVFFTLSKRGRIKGIQLDQKFTFNGPKELQAIPIDQNTFFIDGLRNNHPDIFLHLIGGEWHMSMYSETLKMEPQP